jgi:hypothetical protein
MDFEVDYIMAVGSVQIFLVKEKDSNMATLIKFFDDVDLVEREITYVIRRIEWDYDELESKSNNSLISSWALKYTNYDNSPPDSYKNRAQVVFSIFNKQNPALKIQDLVIDFSRCFVHVKTNLKTHNEEKYKNMVFNYDVLFKSDYSVVNYIKKEVSIRINQNPNYFTPKITNKKVIKENDSMNEWDFDYFYHFKQKGHGISIPDEIVEDPKMKDSISMAFDQELKDHYEDFNRNPEPGQELILSHI